MINGNINDVDQVNEHLSKVDGVMLGRLACDNPYALVAIYQALYPDASFSARSRIVSAYVEFLRTHVTRALPRALVIKPLLNMAHGLAGCRQWKALLLAVACGDDWSGFERALACLQALERESAQ